MDIVLFIYVLVTITVTIHILLVREKDVDVAPAADAVATATTDAVATATTDAVATATTDDDDLLPGEEEDHWEDLADLWEFPEIGKKKSPVMMTGDCKYNRALRGCGRRGKGKQKGGKHIDKKKLRRADTRAHLSLLELI